MNTTIVNKKLTQAMLQADSYDHPVSNIELIETHISQVFLTGDYAYKIKKPVDFGFLDFRTLAQRKFFCEEELRLNRRLAPDIYLEVVPITVSAGKIQLRGAGEIIEYAIRMRQFDAHNLLNRLLASAAISHQHILSLADAIADFHSVIEINRTDAFGSADDVIKPVIENFRILNTYIKPAPQRQQLAAIQANSLRTHSALKVIFMQRKLAGHIRECHGDLHTGNIALTSNKIIIFDGIEFNASLRWIDTISDIAFLIMDLQDQQQPGYANLLLNRYLEISGDYDGLAVLTFYKMYRAMVRAKVCCLRLQQSDISPEASVLLHQQLQNYLDLALQYCQPTTPFLAITCGVSGSGKSWLAQQLAEPTAAIVIRSDKERKRLPDISADDLYLTQNTDRVYALILQLARQVAEYNYSVIVDATFLTIFWRERAQSIAQQMGFKFHILHCQADSRILERRIAQRQTESTNLSNADSKVLHHQLATLQPLAASEQAFTIEIDTSREIDFNAIQQQLMPGHKKTG